MGGGISTVNIPQVELPEGYTAIVTGGHQGLGYEVSKYLALLGARVIIACDNASKAQAAILRIQADAIDIKGQVDSLLPDDESQAFDITSRDSDVSGPNLKVEFMKMDFSSLDNVTHFVAAFKEKGYPLNLLVCNSSVVEVPKAYTEDGYEMHFQLNYLGHFLLSLMLLPSMKAVDGEARIVMVTSKDHTSGDFNPKTAQGKGAYNKSTYYANSKLCQIMQMYCFERRLAGSNVLSYSVHGGAIDTALKKNMDNPAAWGTVYTVARSLGKIANNVSKNVTNCLSVCLSAQLTDLRGSFFADGVPITPSPKARDVKMQEILWNYTVGLLDNQLSSEMLEGLTVTPEEVEQEINPNKE